MRRHLAASVCCGVVITGSAVACAVLLAHVISGIVTDPASRTVSHWSGALWILVTLWVVRAAAQWLQARLSQRGATAVIAEFNHRVLTTVCALPPPRLAALRDDAAVLATRGLDDLRPYFTRYLPAVLLSGLLTPAAVVVMACYDVRSAVIVLIALPLVPLFMVLIGLVTAERSAASLTAMTTLQSRLLDLIAGIPTLRALGRAEGPAHRISELAAAHRHSTMATLRITFLSALVLELLATLGVALVAVSVGLRLVFGEVELSTALTALLLAPEVFWPLRRVGTEFHAAQDGKTAAEKAFGMLDGAPEPIGGALSVAAGGKTIRLDDVTVDGRDGAAPHRLTADIEPGSVTVLTGPNGAGKSTALQVILGLTKPTSGRVLVAGVNVDDLDLRAWWAQVAWLTQRPALVPGTVRENLELFGAVDDLDEACRTAGFDDVLATLPDGLDTMIGRGGEGLSLGQRQRLGIARVLGSPAPVLLLDEPTSHLDTELEDRVLRAVIERARAGATVVLVGHRERVTAIGDHVVHVGGEVLV
ncbi:thiol reductant ABC exporter subunit CydD [Mycolicibacterium sp. P9-64]|uniref:thiol reductant ABC exporter subunit CydD n=1 Tax=Mycolicibacterium sp. P9-64 TaxID=2024612 RepID=UPI0011EEE72F|nr:thiol reductant ABC exporter subunit CydD [Mycolicibacterium sp. P9-64]KAA0084712.1 thiol reductant ABC exporter subunit CydD [Mycolicibacterium sp. P9-64]